jgi:hypothetical protein
VPPLAPKPASQRTGPATPPPQPPPLAQRRRAPAPANGFAAGEPLAADGDEHLPEIAAIMDFFRRDDA